MPRWRPGGLSSRSVPTRSSSSTCANNPNTTIFEGPADLAETDGDVVVEWQDQSGQGNHAILSNSPIISTGPTYSTTSHLGNPAVQFPLTAPSNNNKRLRLNTPLVTTTSQFNIRAVVKTTGNTNDEIPIAMNYGVGNAHGFELMVYRNRFEFYVGYSLAADPNNRLISPLINDGQWYEVEVERRADLFTMRVDGIVVDTDSYPGAFTGNRNFTIGNGSDYNAGAVGATTLNDIASIFVSVPEPAAGATVLALAGFTLVGRAHRGRAG